MLKMMAISDKSQNQNSSKFSWPFALVILALLVVTEALPPIFGTGYNAKWDWGFFYVTMRFVLLPAACFAHVGWNLVRLIKSRKEKLQLIQFSSVVISFGYLVSLFVHPLPLAAWN